MACSWFLSQTPLFANYENNLTSSSSLNVKNTRRKAAEIARLFDHLGREKERLLRIHRQSYINDRTRLAIGTRRIRPVCFRKTCVTLSSLSLLRWIIHTIIQKSIWKIYKIWIYLYFCGEEKNLTGPPSSSDSQLRVDSLIVIIKVFALQGVFSSD